MRLIAAGLCFFPIAYAQSVSVNMGGNFTYNQVGSIETVTVTGPGSGTVSPFGAGTVTGSFSINYALSGNPLTGTFTFSVPSAGSFTVSYSTSYNSGATMITFNPSLSGGTGLFSNAAGSLQLLWSENVTGGSKGTFTLTGTGTIGGAATPFPVPNAPAGAGPLGDPSLVNCTS